MDKSFFCSRCYEELSEVKIVLPNKEGICMTCYDLEQKVLFNELEIQWRFLKVNPKEWITIKFPERDEKGR